MHVHIKNLFKYSENLQHIKHLNYNPTNKMYFFIMHFSTAGQQQPLHSLLKSDLRYTLILSFTQTRCKESEVSLAPNMWC